MYIRINDIKGEKKELTYLIQFTQTRKSQLSECLAIMLNMRY